MVFAEREDLRSRAITFAVECIFQHLGRLVQTVAWRVGDWVPQRPLWYPVTDAPSDCLNKAPEMLKDTFDGEGYSARPKVLSLGKNHDASKA